MTHPTPGELLELHFGECGPVRGARRAAHARRCPDCRALLADVAWAERLLAAVPEVEPPADGLDRVLARVAPAAAIVPRRTPAWRAALPSAAALAAGTLAAVLGGMTAALVFFAAGSLVTLSLAPALILESQRRRGAPLAR
jgi:anti-sigma factor RsiW